MLKEMKITLPEGCEIEKVEIVDGRAVATISMNAELPKLPKTWDEFCEMYPIKDGECFVENGSGETVVADFKERTRRTNYKDIYPDRATAEAALALCQLIQLRDVYNGDWVPDWCGYGQNYIIGFDGGDIDLLDRDTVSPSPLCFKTRELRDEFTQNFRSMIEKLKPLYGIKKGGDNE